MNGNIYIYLLFMALVTFALRVGPLVFAKKEITNPLIRSFLYYVPYVTLTVMTVPAILRCTQSPISGAAALVAGSLIAWKGGSLFVVAVSVCAVVFLVELIPGVG